MIGTINCVYETPCGWCSKWDKKCDNMCRKCYARKTVPYVDQQYISITAQN